MTYFRSEPRQQKRRVDSELKSNPEIEASDVPIKIGDLRVGLAMGNKAITRREEKVRIEVVTKNGDPLKTVVAL